MDKIFKLNIECWGGVELRGRGAWTWRRIEKGRGNQRRELGWSGQVHHRTSSAPPSPPHIPVNLGKKKKKSNVQNTNPCAAQLVWRTVCLESRQEGDDSQRSVRRTMRQQPVPEDNPVLELGQRAGNYTGSGTDRLFLGIKTRIC